MIVCMCADVIESEIIAAAKTSSKKEDVLLSTGAASGCGCCYHSVCAIIESTYKDG